MIKSTQDCLAVNWSGLLRVARSDGSCGMSTTRKQESELLLKAVRLQFRHNFKPCGHAASLEADASQILWLVYRCDLARAIEKWGGPSQVAEELAYEVASRTSRPTKSPTSKVNTWLHSVPKMGTTVWHHYCCLSG